MISAIILAYNRSAEALLTITKLKALREKLPYELEIIVVDNASTDGISELILEKHPDVILITRHNNNGVAGWNDGFAVATQQYLLVLDDDSHIENGLAESILYLQMNPNVGILAFNIVDEELKGDPLLNPDDAWKHLQKIMGFIGCGAIIRKTVYEKIGGFAEWLFIYTHEFEYSLRALNAGFDTRFFNLGTVVHRASKLNRTNKRLRIFSTRNEMAIVYAHFGTNKYKYLLRTWLNNFKFIKREGIISGYYVFLGAIEFLKMRNRLTKSPVKEHVQNFYAENFWSTKPI
jgi:GT2 family glycosyltransferase